MVVKTREIGTAAVVGVVVDGVLTGVLSATSLNLLYAIIVGAFVGGVAASYVLYGTVREAAFAGLLSAVVAVPFLMGVSDILTIFGLIPIPSPAQQPSMADLQSAVAEIAMINLLASSLGSVMLGAIRHPQPPMPQPLQPLPTGTIPQSRYCVQCGAHLQGGTVICPHCGARQP